MATISHTRPKIGAVALLSTLLAISATFALIQADRSPQIKSVVNIVQPPALVERNEQLPPAEEVRPHEPLPSVDAFEPIAPLQLPEETAVVPQIAESTAAQPPAVEQQSVPVEPVKPAGEVLTIKIGPGQSLTSVWREHGKTIRGAFLADIALAKISTAARTIREGEKIEITIQDGDIVQLRRRLRDGSTVTITGNSIDGYSSELKKVTYEERERLVTGTIHTSFAEAARAADVPYEIVDQLVDLFSGRLDFRRDLHPGNTFTVSYIERISDAGQIEEGAINSASIRSDSGAIRAAIRHTDNAGASHFYDEEGKPLGNYFLRYPVKFSRVASVFSDARLHPVLGRMRAHNGVDFAAPVGTPVRAVADGVVEVASWRGAAGRMVKIRHGERYATAYLHLSKIAPEVRVGSRVARGQTIGAVGMSGLATGPHLHFSLYDRGNYVDPLKSNLPTLSPEKRSLPGEVLMAAMNSIRSAHETVLLAANVSTTERSA